MPARHWLVAAAVGFGGALAMTPVVNLIADPMTRFMAGLVVGAAWMQTCVAVAIARWDGRR